MKPSNEKNIYFTKQTKRLYNTYQANEESKLFLSIHEGMALSCRRPGNPDISTSLRQFE
jgi:hypothetical protein